MNEAIKVIDETTYHQEKERQIKWYKKNLGNKGYAILSLPYKKIGEETASNDCPLYILYFNTTAFADVTVNGKINQGYIVEHVNAPQGLKLNSDEQKNALGTLLSRIEYQPKRPVVPVIDKPESEIATEGLESSKRGKK